MDIKLWKKGKEKIDRLIKSAGSLLYQNIVKVVSFIEQIEDKDTIFRYGLCLAYRQTAGLCSGVHSQ